MTECRDTGTPDAVPTSSFLLDVIRQSALAWKAKGACLGADPELFFSETNTERVISEYCRTCPVLAECRQFADEYREHFGIWGGESARERRRRWKANGIAFDSRLR